MTDPTVIAGGIVLVIGSIATAVVTVINALAARDERTANATERATSAQARAVQLDATHAASRKADTIIDTATEIQRSTNGTLSKLQNQLESAQDEIRSLKTLMATILAAQDEAHRLQGVHETQIAAALAMPVGGWQRRSTDRPPKDPHA